MQHSLSRPLKSGYLPSLDGWRAIAIAAVLMSHDVVWSIMGHSLEPIRRLGGDGVELFFAISGFLITTRILEEEALVGRFDIRRFYVRRLFRIQPAALAYLTCVALLFAFGVYPKEWSRWLGAFFMYLNFMYRPGPSLLGHFWSLAVEEHFYILLSLLFLFCKKHRLLVLGLLWMLFMAPVWLPNPQRFGLPNWYQSNRSTQQHLHYLLIASFMAVLMRREEIKRAVRFALRPWVIFPLTLILAAAHNASGQLLRHEHLSPFRHVLGENIFIDSYFLILWIVSTVFHPRSLTTRILEFRPLRYVGKLSYSFYLWHVLFFYAAGDPNILRNHVARFLSTSPVRYLAAVAATLLLD